MDIEQAMQRLRKAFEDDPHYAFTWHANIACCVQDAGCTHEQGNEAAARFMKAAFGVNTDTQEGTEMQESEDSSRGRKMSDDKPLAHKYKHVCNGTSSYDYAIYCEYCGHIVFDANHTSVTDKRYKMSIMGCPLAPETKNAN